MLNSCRPYDKPVVINTDKASAYSLAIQTLKQSGKIAQEVIHRQVKYLNNGVENTHRQLKRLIRPTLGSKSMKTAYATIKGFESMLSLKKGQAKYFQYQHEIREEVRLVERCFGLGNCVIADAMEYIKQIIHDNPELQYQFA